MPARNNLALARRMLVPLRSDLEAVCSFMVPVCRHLGLLRSAVPVLRNFYGVDAQIGWRQSLNLYGAAAQVRAVLYLRRYCGCSCPARSTSGCLQYPLFRS